MRFGIDFGTTRTVIAAVDRGNYPLVNVIDANGDAQDHIPSVVALDGDRLLAGWSAVSRDYPTLARSFKRLLGSPDVTADTPVDLGDESRPLGEVLCTFATGVIEALREYQAALDDTSEIEVMLGVPANSRSAQRLLTLDAFTRGGANVLGLVNEPSAAAFEYSHRHARTLTSKRSSVIVYDLGGGTFDATLVRIDGHQHDVENSLGISHLGGDDFDEILADMALDAAGRDADAFGRRARRRLLDEARTAKEQLKPQSRRLVLEISYEDVIVGVPEFYDAVTPLVERTLDAMRPLIGSSESLTDTEVAGVYLVGGASSLPLVPRLLRERFGRRVHRSPLPTASTAVGLAIAVDPNSGYLLRDRLSRGVGVFRERDGGRGVSFDPLVAPGTRPDSSGTIRITRRYRAAHNVGWFRFVEYSALDASRDTPGDLALIAEVLVPFDGALKDVADLTQVPVEHSDLWPEVEETVTIDPDGIASIRIDVPSQGISVLADVSLSGRGVD
ncbi:Hsp70 family protein [Corynebacterium testudinoris]|uniref:Hsp70 protein n=1 Tax=Corynebacterium testudinoris TaxID=136857 RepID=A0A0G3HE39_9CORY|nr:Hsp70 family protein [Corynebacterium testudinoris]AKK09417.1 Hsp70 protein [Corynebacterium testudinoris]MBX8995214.1 Hsp70 family protein [Corynebacterium testudinoris]